jgi:hypothetical protein
MFEICFIQESFKAIHKIAFLQSLVIENKYIFLAKTSIIFEPLRILFLLFVKNIYYAYIIQIKSIFDSYFKAAYKKQSGQGRLHETLIKELKVP